ncbi:oxidoreductase [Mycolicibacterium conceptionense]|uniref:Propionate 3-nitronate monooxygenase n=1 Tax=Mycolicibacterium conceptionense TaxID=451644 RepID=A0A0U1DL08_9MYCO|nr:oxidoreductase [Mycolicibacterium conceptionense]
MGTFDIRGLRRPVIVAPMAGGPSTPELAAAGSNAGGLGFLAAGYLTADALAEKIAAARSLTTEPLGVNLFAPQPSAGTPEQIQAYAAELAGEAQRYGVELGAPRYDDDAWAAKLDLVFDLRPEVVSFTFGLPSAPEIDRLRGAGITTVGTVTTLDEAWLAVGRGIDALAVQGPAAGGHRGTFDPAASPASQSLDHLLADVLAAVDVPVVAAGGGWSAPTTWRVCWPPVRWPPNSVPRSCWPTKPAAAPCTALPCRARSSPKPLSPGHFPAGTPEGCATASSPNMMRRPRSATPRSTT